LVRPAREDELAWINARYDEVGFLHSKTATECLIAELNGARAGLGRLVELDARNAELGGMFVFSAYRGRGIAGAIVGKLLERSAGYERVFCLPFAHLAEFYQGFGFRPFDDHDAVPPAVAEKLDWCNLELGKTLLLAIERA
ncbi:MAG TPA: GNAT family N-acetyltransferase, partial [Bdellovibrionota bacterium]|nr:GNAT family N-acetyltransferase [Bdellovibrionota bacterium]